jgi:predicted small secreted protein
VEEGSGARFDTERPKEVRRATRKPTLEEPEHYGAPTVDSPDFRSGRIGGAAGTVRALRVGASVIGASGEQKMSRMPRMLICLLAVLLMPWLNACNTARGMGEDIQALGRAMSGTAEDVEEDISAEPESPAEATTPSTPEPAPR